MHPIFRKDVLSIFIVQIFGLLTLSLYGTYFGILLDRLETSALLIGFVFASRNLIQIFLRVPFSEISQSIGRKPLIIGGVLCYTLSHGFLYLANHWIYVLVGTLCLGIGMSMHWPAVFSYIGDIAGDEYGKINGVIFQGQDIGIIVGAFLASYLLNNEFIILKDLFGVVFIIGMLGTILALFILPEVLEDSNRVIVESRILAAWSSFRNMIGSLITLTKQYPLGLIFVFEFLVTFAEFFLVSFFPLLMVISFGYKDGDVANIVFYSTLITILIKPYFGVIFDRFGYKQPVLIALTITGGMYYIISIVTNFWSLLIIYTIAISSLFVCFIATTGATNNNVIPGERGLAMGVLGVYIASGRAFSSVALAPVLEVLENVTGSRAQGVIELFRFTGILIIILVLILVMISRSLETRQEKYKQIEN